MPLNHDELIKAAELVAEMKDMKVTLKYSLVGSGFTAVTTFVGGIVAGPFGLAAGATFGGLVACTTMKSKFRSAVQIIREEMTEAQKDQLAMHIQNALKDLDIYDAMELFAIISSQEAAFVIVSSVVKKYLEGDMKYSVMSN